MGDSKELLWNRAGIFKKKERKICYTICETHFDLLMTNFKKNKVCSHPAHNEQYKQKQKRLTLKASKMVYQISLESSRDFFYAEGALIPTNGWLCSTHKKELFNSLTAIRVVKALKGQSKQDEESSNDESENDNDFEVGSEGMDESIPQDYDQPMTSEEQSESSQPSSVESDDKHDPDFTLQEENVRAAVDERIAIINRLLEENNIQQRFRTFMTKRFSSYKYRGMRHWLKLVGSTVAAVLHSVLKDESDDMDLWTTLVDSKFVERNLHGCITPSRLIEEVIVAYNHATNRREKIRLLSLVSSQFSFEYLSLFNQPKAKKGAAISKPKKPDTDDSDSDEYSKTEFFDIEINEEEVCLTEKDDRNQEEKLFFDEDLDKEIGHHQVEAKWVPTLPKSLYYEAKKHYLGHGFAFAPLKATIARRQRLDPAMIEVLEEFLTSNDIIQDTAYGTKKVRDASGEDHTIAKIIRTMTASELVKMATTFLIESGFKPPTRATLFKIIHGLPASSKKSLKGINPFQAKAMEAFGAWKSIVVQLAESYDMDPSMKNALLKSISNAHNYIRNYYKFSLELSSNCASHCINYCLSDPETKESGEYSQQCQHDHEESCFQCENIRRIWKGLLQLIEKHKNEMDDLQFQEHKKLINDSFDHIFCYQKHLMRAAGQNMAWDSLYDDKGETCLVVQDWAMKYLPEKFRESTADWYAKAGYSWHIIAFLRRMKTKDGLVQEIDVHVSVVEKENKQESSVNFALLKKSLEIYHKAHPEVKRVWIKSDNAGTYHSESLILSLHSIKDRLPLKIAGYLFSASGAGKDVCDRFSAIIKRSVAKYVLTGQNIESPRDFALAMVCHGDISNCLVLYGEVKGITKATKEKDQQINSIYLLNDFEFGEGAKLTVRKQSLIGNGHELNVKQVKQEAFYECEIVLQNKQTIPADENVPAELCKPRKHHALTEKKKKKQPTTQVEEGSDEELEDTEEEGALFYCSKDENCTKTFIRYRHLQQHELFGKCHIPKDLSTIEGMSRSYLKKFSVNPDNFVHAGSKKVINMKDLELVEVPKEFNVAKNDPTMFTMGCALQTKRTNKRFSKKLINFLKEIFLKGERTGRKATPIQTEKDLRRARDENGKLMFECDEWLDELQIKSYFSRLASKKGSKILNMKDLTMTNEDIDEVLDNAEVQQVMNTQNAILETLNQEEVKVDLTKHPMKVSTYLVIVLQFYAQESYFALLISNYRWEM